MSSVITFYSYKGGVGRTMSLANIAVLLSHWGHRVLMVDWDLEAPGLEHFFAGKDKEYIDIEIVKDKIGLVDLLDLENRLDWHDAIIPINVPSENRSRTPNIDFISAGRRDDEYFKKVRNFHIDEFYANGGGIHIEQLRNEWKNEYDYVLIDSRTGVTEIGGICTIQLPDILVLLFTATEQGFEGILDIAQRASNAQQKLPYERQKLAFLPIPTKFDTQAEFKLSQDWLNIFAEKLTPIYNDWLPSRVNKKHFLELTKVPYISYFSFGEKLPVVEQGVKEPTGLGYAYENIALLLANNLDNAVDLMQNRKKLVADMQVKEVVVYVNYVSTDETFASVIKFALNEVSNCKIKLIDNTILPGDDWEIAILRKYKAADIIILILTPTFVISEFVKKSIPPILNLKDKKIIPVLAQEYRNSYAGVTAERLGINRYIPLTLYDKPFFPKPEDISTIEIIKYTTDIFEKIFAQYLAEKEDSLNEMAW